jgi:hypothetical protein
MLIINKGVSVGDVVTLKLVSGEEIIGKLDKETEQSYFISRPMSLRHDPKGLGMTPFLFTVHPNSVVPIDIKSVMVYITSDSEMADSYLEGVSGIQLK